MLKMNYSAVSIMFANNKKSVKITGKEWNVNKSNKKNMNEQKKDEQKNQGKHNEADLKGVLSQFETLLDEYMVKKAPFALPKEVKEFIVKISPYLVIIFALMFLPILFSALGLSAIFGPFAMMGGLGWGYGAMISLAIGFITLIMEVVAVPGLFKRTKSSWRLVFYASIVSFIGSILSIHGIFGGIIGGIIGAVIGWYILFQVKDLYKN